ncbi:sigma 54-interacting transcriptional regulator [candidate division WOR-3 bacterium]|nr:sigma 54-interacting transcriptional regulator [candidate division WOR-3 bacterium]
MKSRHAARPVATAQTDAILESISDGVFTVDLNWRITSFNRAAEKITGVKRAEAIGRHCSEVFRSSMCQDDCALKHSIKTGRPVVGKSCYIITAEGERIPISVSTAIMRNKTGKVVGGAETFRDLSEVEALREELAGHYRVGELTSHSPLMQRVFEVLPAIAASPSTVLVLGETGTGKELVARTIHSLSPRSRGPFIAVNCGALPDTLLESELFGYKAGAFTGANRDKPGRFALARGGAILLDEIGEMSPALQVKLLRVLEERTFEPLGSTRPEKTDARVMVATNKDLASLVRQGSFRDDLYYRVNVIRIELPPLRRRKEDIPLIVEHFIARFNRLQRGLPPLSSDENGGCTRPARSAITGVSVEALSLLMAYDWPGNVRELENVIERAFVLCSAGQIGIEHLPVELTARAVASRHPSISLSLDSASTIRKARELLEAETIRKAIDKAGGNRSAAAKELGIHKTTLFRKLKQLGIDPPEQDGRSRRRS